MNSLRCSIDTRNQRPTMAQSVGGKPPTRWLRRCQMSKIATDRMEATIIDIAESMIILAPRMCANMCDEPQFYMSYINAIVI